MVKYFCILYASIELNLILVKNVRIIYIHFINENFIYSPVILKIKLKSIWYVQSMHCWYIDFSYNFNLLRYDWLWCSVAWKYYWRYANSWLSSVELLSSKNNYTNYSIKYKHNNNNCLIHLVIFKIILIISYCHVWGYQGGYCRVCYDKIELPV